MKFGKPVTLDALLTQLAGQVRTNRGTIPADLVFASLAPEESFLSQPPGQRFVVVSPGNFQVDEPLWAGAGRNAMGVNGRFRLSLYRQYSTDQELRSDKELADATIGLIPLFAKVVNALHCYEAPDGTGWSFLREPMRCEMFDFRPKRIEKSNWALLSTTFAAKFVLTLESGDTPP